MPNSVIPTGADHRERGGLRSGGACCLTGAGCPRSRAFRDLGFQSRVMLGILLEGLANCRVPHPNVALFATLGWDSTPAERLRFVFSAIVSSWADILFAQI